MADRIHPRLLRRRNELGVLLGLEDPTELDAALLEIQTELERSGYHLRFARWERIARRRYTRLHPTGNIGRTPGSDNMALRQLGLSLATLWNHLTGCDPTRRVDGYGRRKSRRRQSKRARPPKPWEETGPYRDFVEAVLGVLPRPLRATRKGRIPSVSYFVRVSIEEFAAAQGADDEARRRGLLPEQRWLRRRNEPTVN